MKTIYDAQDACKCEGAHLLKMPEAYKPDSLEVYVNGAFMTPGDHADYRPGEEFISFPKNCRELGIQ